MIEFLGWMHCQLACVTPHLDLDGLLSSQNPLSAEDDGDHVGVPLLPVQGPRRHQEPGLAQYELLSGLVVGNQVGRDPAILVIHIDAEISNNSS